MQTLLRIPVSDEVYKQLSDQARAAHKEIEELIADRLPQLLSNSQKPIVINDEARRKLEALLGRNFNEPWELIRSVEQALSVSIGEVKVEIPPKLLERLRSRAIGFPYEKFISMTLTRLLEEYCGLR